MQPEPAEPTIPAAAPDHGIHSIRFAWAQPADYEPLAQLWQSTPGVWVNESDSRERYEAFLRRNPELSQVARLEEEIIGGVLCGHDGRYGFLHHLVVHPRHQRDHVGTQLVQRALHALAQQHIRRCYAIVQEQNAQGMNFWLALGWQPRSGINLMSIVLESVE